MKPYPAYKDSGMAWLGEVPAHWEVKRLKHILARNDGGAWGEDGSSDDTPVLRSTEINLNGTWNLAEPARRKLTKRELDATRLISGDLLVTKSSGSSAHIGKTALVTKEVEAMGASFSNFMQRLRLDTAHHPVIYFHFLNNQIGREQLDYLSSTTTGLKNLNAAILGDVSVTSPPLPEQTAIAAYLDRKTAQIDAVIAKKERLIELLREERTAVISQAVTRGLNPDAPMKDSGVAWLGEVPAHWQLRRLKFAAKVNPSRSETRNLPLDLEVSFYPMEAVGFGELFEGQTRLLGEVSSGFTYFRDDDMLIAKITPSFENGKGALATGLTNGIGFGTTELHVVRPSRELHKRFLFYMTYSHEFRHPGEGMMDGTAGQKRVPSDFLIDYRAAIPPIPEQTAIVENLDQKIAEVDQTIARTEVQIERLREYRTALISAVVTGKVDVRKEAAL